MTIRSMPANEAFRRSWDRMEKAKRREERRRQRELERSLGSNAQVLRQLSRQRGR